MFKKKTDALVQVNFPLNIKSKPTNKQANQHRGKKQKKQTNAHVCFEKQSNTTICTCWSVATSPDVLVD